jgi:hypothetical protein
MPPCARLFWTAPGNRVSVACCIIIAASACVWAQPRINFTGSVRGRLEAWDWFRADPAQSSYTYGATILRLNLSQSSSRFEWHADGAFPVFLNLPAHAVGPDPIGPVGYGGDYFLANGRRSLGATVLRQAFGGLSSDGGGLKFRVGRFEFADGSEAVPPDGDLAALKQERVNQRLIATFSYALRSLDGAQLTFAKGATTVTAMAVRLVEGSFQLRALNEIHAEVAYSAYTRYLGARRTKNELRVFLLGYQDHRAVTKAVYGGPLRLATPGGHYLAEIHAGPGAADMVLWAALQFGQWGALRHRASEIAVEGGYRFAAGWQPWIRAGYFRGSGDPDSRDSRHNTFFQVLSTPRAYERFPFAILMNTEDAFLQFRVRPHRKLTLRSEVHSVRLTDPHDLWYDGGGAYQEGTFGYLGRPAGGARRVGTALDLSADCALTRNTSVVVYGGIARGGAVAAAVYPAAGARPRARLASVEFVRRF